MRNQKNEDGPGVWAGWGGGHGGIRLSWVPTPWADFSVWGPQTGCPQRFLLGWPTLPRLPPSPCGLGGRNLRPLSLPSRGRRKDRVCTGPGTAPDSAALRPLRPGPGGARPGRWGPLPLLPGSGHRWPPPHPPHTPLKAPLSLQPGEPPTDTTFAVAAGVQSLSPVQLCDPNSSPWLCPAHFHYLSISSSVKQEG